MRYLPTGKSEGCREGSVGCNLDGRIHPIETRHGYFCGFHQEVPCGMQGEPMTHEGFVTFTLYPCNAAPESCQKPRKAAQQIAGGLELKLAQASP